MFQFLRFGLIASLAALPSACVIEVVREAPAETRSDASPEVREDTGASVVDSSVETSVADTFVAPDTHVAPDTYVPPADTFVAPDTAVADTYVPPVDAAPPGIVLTFPTSTDPRTGSSSVYGGKLWPALDDGGADFTVTRTVSLGTTPVRTITASIPLDTSTLKFGLWTDLELATPTTTIPCAGRYVVPGDTVLTCARTTSSTLTGTVTLTMRVRQCNGGYGVFCNSFGIGPGTVTLKE